MENQTTQFVSIGDFYEQWLGQKMPNDQYHNQLSTQEWNTGTECGKACVQIIIAATLLKNASDPSVRQEIIWAALHAIEVVCFG